MEELFPILLQLLSDTSDEVKMKIRLVFLIS